jgi:protoporphyrinogen oxidase
VTLPAGQAGNGAGEAGLVPTDPRSRGRTRHRVAVVGGGICGSAAALDLVRAGNDVVLLERSPSLGGLVVSFEVAGTPLECFYHHIFPHEHEIRGLIEDLGLSERLGWFESSVGVLTDGRIWPFTSPLDLLRFRPLPFIDRLHTGIGALRLGRARQWEDLDDVAARDWLRKACGEHAGQVVWDPLLAAKFGPGAPGVPAAWMWGRFQQRSGARSKGAERLGYLRGGFRQLFEALAARLESLGVDIRTGVTVKGIECEGDRVVGVATDDGPVEVDSVLYAGTLPGLAPLLPADRVDPRWTAIGGLSVQCTVLELARSISPIYWTNVCDRELPFGGIIEHTNLLPRADYGDRHVVYLSRYFMADEPIAKTDSVTESQRWVDALIDRVPNIRSDDVLAIHPFRTPYAAPLVQLGHLGRIPPMRSHLRGLYVATTAQIYPQDRGMSEGVRMGQESAALIHADAVAPGQRV